MTGFETVGVDERIARHLVSLGYGEPTPVQRAAIPPLLAGRDVTIEAATGTGKTLAYGIPLIERSEGTELAALVLVPTRELAAQVARDLDEAGRPFGFSAASFTGGRDAAHDASALKRKPPVCLVATPGRLLDLLERVSLDLSRLRVLVLDEADRMLDMGFLPDVERVLEQLPTPRQTVLASATLEESVMALARRALHEPEELRVDSESMGPALEHTRLNVFDTDKERSLLALLVQEDPERVIVFVERRAQVDDLAKVLRAHGFVADVLHGDRKHAQRRHVMDLFRVGSSKVLVATDVASRGLDVPEVDLIVNYDPPRNSQDYVHRGGRTGRFGRRGRVVTLFLPEQKSLRLGLEYWTGIEFVPYRLTASPPPSVEEPKAKAKAKPQAPAKKAASSRPAAKSAASPPRRSTAPRTPRNEERRSGRSGGGPQGPQGRGSGSGRPQRDRRPPRG